MVKSVQVAVRLTEDKREALEEAAEASSRSMSSYLDHALTRMLREEGFLPRPVKPTPKLQRPVKPAPKPHPTRAHR